MAEGTAVNNTPITIGNQMWDLLQRNPHLYDVIFRVGVDGMVVKGLKFVLMAASPVLEVVLGHENVEEHILADVDSTAFQLLIEFVIRDTWSVEALKARDLTRPILISLLDMCRRFEITKAIQNLEEAADGYIRSFLYYKDTDELLKLSQSSLAAIVSCEGLPLEESDIWECVCRWAKFRCEQTHIEASGENMRKVLGLVLLEVRFPIMSATEFFKIFQLHIDLFSDPEVKAINKFISLDYDEKQKYDGSQIPFKTHARKQPMPKPQFDGDMLCLTQNLKIGHRLPFVCTGDKKLNYFQTCNGPIELHGIGFFGPIDLDVNSYFDVTVIIERWSNSYVKDLSGRKEKRISTRKPGIFHYMFDKPIAIEPTADADESSWNLNDFYRVLFWLKGPNTGAVVRMEGHKGTVEQAGVKFKFLWLSGRNQIAEFLYKKL